MLTTLEVWMADQIVALSRSPGDARRIAHELLRNMQGAAILMAAYGKTNVILDTIDDLDARIDGL